MQKQLPKSKARLSAHFDHRAVESKWRKIWEENRLYQPDIKRSKNPFYNLMMFPYPSALGLHVGNIYAFVGSDIYGRLKRMQGFNVFEPIGLDGFGIHSENFALKIGKHPMDLSKKTESAIYAQLRSIGNGFAWSHKLETYISDYYKWTQWIFIRLFKRGLAYRAEASVNWCPSCLTVLADEQVVVRKSDVGSQKSDNPKSEIRNPKSGNVCERCGTEVEKRKLKQWFFKITNYAGRLLLGLGKIDWSEKVKVAQKNWLGKSEGLLLKFESDIESNSQVEVFTTRPDTLFGVTFMALAPEHPQVIKILDKSKGLLRRQIQKYVTDSIKKPESERIVLTEGEKQKAPELVKTGIKTGFHCTNPASGKRVPVFIADYVLMSYGTGAVMGVPAHDHRDYLFAKKYGIDIVKVVKPAGPVSSFLPASAQSSQPSKSSQSSEPFDLRAVGIPSTAATRLVDSLSQQSFTDYGVLVNSGEFNGLTSQEAIGAISDLAVKKGFGAKNVMWHLRDWIISRQRYWGSPIPIIYCRKCWEVKSQKSKVKSQEGVDVAIIAGIEHWIHPVPEKDLPVELPYIKNFKPTGTGVSPLATDPNFVKVKCPDCGSEARRETDVSDTFLDSAWYFLRYPSQSHKSQVTSHKFPWGREVTRKWLPVDMYIGGAERSVLHLLYSRFLTMAFYDTGLLDFEEPFSKFRAHGLLISEGAKMSKSKGNVVLPDAYIKKYGADTLRTYLMFCGRFDQGGDFRDTGIEGMSRFLKRIWRLVRENLKFKIENLKLSGEAAFMMNKTIKKVTEDIENLRYNTAIAAIMEWVNFLEEKVNKKQSERLITHNSSLITSDEVENLLLLLAPFAPYMTEELWQQLKVTKVSKGTKVTKVHGTSDIFDTFDTFDSIHLHPWPKYDERLATSSKIELVVQVNGKVRDRLAVDRGIEKEDAQRLVLDLKNTQKYVSDKKPKKVIFVKDRLINIVV